MKIGQVALLSIRPSLLTVITVLFMTERRRRSGGALDHGHWEPDNGATAGRSFICLWQTHFQVMQKL